MADQEGMAEVVARALNAYYGEDVARAVDSGDSRGFYVEVKFSFASSEWSIFLEED